MFEWLFAKDSAPAYPVRARVLVNTQSGEVFRGALWAQEPEFLVLKGATLLRPRNESTPLDGDVVVYRANVAFVQVLGWPEAAGA